MYERLDDVTLDSIVNNRKYELWVDQALRHHGFRTDGFPHWMQVNVRSLDEITEDDIYEYHHDLGETGELDALLTQFSNEVFFLLFGNRALLARLNNYVAAAVRDISKDDVCGMQYRPQWAGHRAQRQALRPYHSARRRW